MEIPFEPDPVDSPTVVYGEGPPAVYYSTRDDKNVRVTFQGWDALRVCRGEYRPYPQEPDPYAHFWLYTVSPSPWLRERHAYEARHYRGCYEFGGDVDRMLTDYDHYLLSFHDEFVEIIAEGIWFEKADGPFPADERFEGHPLLDLPAATTVTRFEAAGIVCHVRANPKPLETVLADARYCAQPLFHFAPELDSGTSVTYRLDVRSRNGQVKTILRDCLGTVRAEIPGVAGLDEAVRSVEPHIRELAERRNAMERER